MYCPSDTSSSLLHAEPRSTPQFYPDLSCPSGTSTLDAGGKTPLSLEPSIPERVSKSDIMHKRHTLATDSTGHTQRHDTSPGLKYPGPSKPPTPTFIHRFTTKIRTQTALAILEAVRPPTLTNSLVAKGQREAALRERGLLPPLRAPDNDISLNGKSHLPDNASGDTPANRIKQDWEARNAMVASQDSSADKKGDSDASPEQRQAITQESSVISSLDQTSRTGYSSSKNKPTTSPKIPTRASPPPPLDVATNGEPFTSFRTPDTTQTAFTTPLPDSPVGPVKADGKTSAPTITVIPATPALKGAINGHKPADLVANSPSSPTSPASANLSPITSRTKSSTLPSLCESDSGVSMATSSSSMDDNAGRTSKADGPPQLTLQRQSGDFMGKFPVILESPVEEGGIEVPEVEAKLTSVKEEPEKDTASAEEKLDSVVSEIPVPRKQRTATDPGTPRRRMSIMVLFGKRDRVERSASEHAPAIARTPSKRQGGLLRSVVGTISRARKRTNTAPVTPTSKAHAQRSAVVTPTSPTSPISPSLDWSANSGVVSSAGSGSLVRNARAPTMHNRGTITTSANELKDDESRRLCEVHFLT